MSAALELRGLRKSFGLPPTEVLKGISFSVAEGEFVALTGRSGSGKSTLLYCLSSLDSPSAGSIHIGGRELPSLSSGELHRLRNEQMGFVFQFHHLLPELSLLENVLMPSRRSGLEGRHHSRATALMEELGIGHRRNALPGQVSGGERQRAALARALVMSPRFLFADEPTGNLDSAAGEGVMQILRRLNQSGGLTVVMVTHDQGYARRAGRQIMLKDGKVEFDRRRRRT